MVNIDQLTNWMYEYFYDKKQTNYNTDSVIISKMQPHHIKYFGKELVTTEIINDIFNTNIKYIKNINDVHLLKRYKESLTLNIFIKLLNGNNEKDLNNLHNHNNIHSVISFLLDDLAVKGKTKHILLNLLNLDIPISELEMLLEKYPQFTNIIKQKNKYVRVSLTEHFFKMVSLDEVIMKEWTDTDFMVLFFQILHVITHSLISVPGIFMFLTISLRKLEAFDSISKNEESFANLSSSVRSISITTFFASRPNSL